MIQAGLLETLQGPGPFTVFAPTDQAFTDAGIDLEALNTPDGVATLADILQYHVVAGNVPSTALSDCMTTDALNGQPLSFAVGNSVMVNDATVTSADVNTSNGVIHVIDKVLTPSDLPNDVPRTAACTGQHHSLVSAVVQAGLLETLQGDGPFTVFAPTDQAFAMQALTWLSLTRQRGRKRWLTSSSTMFWPVLYRPPMCWTAWRDGRQRPPAGLQRGDQCDGERGDRHGKRPARQQRPHSRD